MVKITPPASKALPHAASPNSAEAPKVATKAADLGQVGAASASEGAPVVAIDEPPILRRGPRSPVAEEPADAVEVFELAGCRAFIMQDDTFNPRKDFSNVGTMVMWHRSLAGDDDPGVMVHRHDSPREVADRILERYPGALIVPIHFYEHGGITVSTVPFSDRWDSGSAGLIYAPMDRIQEEWDGDLEKARQWLEGEVKDYDTWLQGDCFGYQVVNQSGVEVDACWGFLGREAVDAEAEEALRGLAAEPGGEVTDFGSSATLPESDDLVVAVKESYGILVSESAGGGATQAYLYPKAMGLEEAKAILRRTYEHFDALEEDGAVSVDGAWVNYFDAVRTELGKHGFICPEVDGGPGWSD